MGTPSQNRAAKINADRHRTPRIVLAVSDAAGGALTLTFDRPMETVLALTDATVFRIFVPDDDLWYDFKASEGYVWSDDRTLNFGASGVSQGAYDGDEFFVRYLGGNVAAKGQSRRLLVGERCDRVETI